jgi:hypothetical protein
MGDIDSNCVAYTQDQVIEKLIEINQLRKIMQIDPLLVYQVEVTNNTSDAAGLESNYVSFVFTSDHTYILDPISSIISDYEESIDSYEDFEMRMNDYQE